MPEISVAVMTFNEEDNIERCLASVQGIADEILIVDSYSADRTQEICLRLGARFIQHHFHGYIEQRQYCIDNAQHDHVLVIDADEELSAALRESMLEAKRNWTADGYTCNRLNSIAGQWIRYSGWYPDRKLRLFDRRKASVKGINPHDKIEIQPGAKLMHLKGDLLHHTYSTVEDQIHQINRFTSIQAQAKFEQGKKTSWLLIHLSPFFKFILNYFLRMGFLDGFYGFIVCRNMAYSTFLKHAKLKALWKNKK